MLREVQTYGIPGSRLAVESPLRQVCPGCAVMAWATGNTDPAGSALILQAVGG